MLFCGFRGVVVWDLFVKYGLKLVIEDYFYVVDGFEIWDVLKEYMIDYVKIFYKNDKFVVEDIEF